jgi:hypothetical protein
LSGRDDKGEQEKLASHWSIVITGVDDLIYNFSLGCSLFYLLPESLADDIGIIHRARKFECR